MCFFVCLLFLPWKIKIQILAIIHSLSMQELIDFLVYNLFFILSMFLSRSHHLTILNQY